MKKLLILAALPVSVAPSAAYSRDIHDSSKMTCYPRNNVPFVVVESTAAGTLTIIGRHGVARVNTLNCTPDDGLGFNAFASGFDYRGRPRELKAHFDRSVSYFDVTDRDDPVIDCGPMTPVSDD
jgi:hypothetical protein